MTKKFIYVSYMRLTDKVSRDWYIDFLIAKGANVEFWDVVPLLREEFDETGQKTTDYSCTLRTYSDVADKLRLPENSDAVYVMLVNYDGYVAELFRLLSKYECKMIFMAWGALPVLSRQVWWKRFSNPVLMVQKIYYKLKGIAYRKLKLVKPFNIVFAAGSVLRKRNLYADKVVPINLIDYDHYCKVKLEDERLVAGRYAVFLDVNLPYQSDLKLAGMHAINPSDYYASLNKFFELLELEHGIKVVIAAHPKANYKADLFNGRKSYHGLTPALVKDADFVVAHQSTSISYVVLNHKPIIFCYTNEMALLYRDEYIRQIRDSAEYLDATIYNIDNILQDEEVHINKVNPTCYDDYKFNYLTSHESEHTSTQDILWREIQMR